MDSTPNEILVHVVSFLQKGELLNVRLVGKRFQDAATRLAFVKIVVHDTTPSVRKFSTLMQECEDQRILHAVESIVFDGLQTDHYDIGAEPTPPLLEKSFKLLHRLPNLQSLRVDFMPDEDNPVVPAEGGHSYYSYYLQVQLSCLAGLSATHGLPRLRTLHLGSLHTYIPSQQETDALLSLFRTLTSLSLSVLSLAHRVHLPSEAISFNASLLRILNAANNITSLELASHTYEGPLCTFAFEKLRFPALVALSLSRFVLAGQEDDEPIHASVNEGGQRLTLETFILNHGHTLRRLAMHSCAVALPDGQWSCILRRFRLQLPLLVTFVCPSLEDGYVMFIDNMLRYQVSNFQEEDLEVDVKEMQHLQEVLLIRRNKQPSGSII